MGLGVYLTMHNLQRTQGFCVDEPEVISWPPEKQNGNMAQTYMKPERLNVSMDATRKA